MPLSFEDAKFLLFQCERKVLEDRAYKHPDIDWFLNGHYIACGLWDKKGCHVVFTSHENFTFNGKEAEELIECYKTSVTSSMW